MARTSLPSGSVTRIAALVGVAAVAALTLTGCIKVDANVAINSDATGSGTFGFELQKEAAGFLGISDLAAFKSNIEEGALTEGEGLESLQDCVTSETETGYAYTCSFANAEFTNPDDLWQITKDGSSIVFTMRNEAAGEEDADMAAMLGETGMGAINVTLEFPGPITSVEGEFAEKTSDTTAKITASMMDTLNVTITSQDSSGGGFATILVVAIAAGVVVLLVVAVILLVMRRRAGTRDSEAVVAGTVATETAVAETVVAETPATETVVAETVVAETPATETPATDTAGQPDENA